MPSPAHSISLMRRGRQPSSTNNEVEDQKSENNNQNISISLESVFKDEGISMPFESPVKEGGDTPAHHVTRKKSLVAEDTNCGCPQCCYCIAVFVTSTSEDTGNETQKETPSVAAVNNDSPVKTADKQTQILALPQQQRRQAAAKPKAALKRSPTHKLWMPRFGSIETFV